VVRPRKVDHLERKCLGAVVARVSEGDWQSDVPEGDGLLAQDHSVELMWAIVELIPGKPQPLPLDNQISYPFLKGRGSFIDHSGVC
jgi:hypothetical protein